MKKTLAALAMLPALAMANPFDVGTTLLGDPRDTNPNGIQVGVSGMVDGDLGSFTISLDPMAGLHDNVKLDTFYLNLVGTAADYNFDNFNPDWAVVATDVTNPSGGGGAANSTTFLFELGDPPPGAGNIVEIGSPLTFDITKLAGDFLASDFGDADTWESNELVVGGGQMGAHLQALDSSICQSGFQCSDSGFATGDYTTQPTPASEPGTMALLSMGLLGLIHTRRRNKAA